MKLVLDACVLFPTIMREMLLGAAENGLFQPLWSERILEEWARATKRLGPEAEPIARVEIALMKARWPDALVPVAPDLEATLSLPDEDDRHVLASAITGQAEAIVTKNLSDFPTRTLAQHSILRRDPDGLLLEAFQAGASDITGVADKMAARAVAAGGQGDIARLLKRSGLPRLAKQFR